MKKALLLFASAALLFAGCAKEQIVGGETDGDQVTVTFTACLTPEGTKAVADKDGKAKKVNHWVMEVRDAQDDLFFRKESKVSPGTLQQTYELKLFKNQSYTLQFWADTKGAYNTDDLTAVSTIGSVANNDARDAFSANVPYTSLVSESKTVTLTRPFAQLNIITNDLKELKKKVVSTTYEKYAPEALQVVAKVPSTFDVQTQTAGDATEQTLTATASYANFLAGNPETTLFMDYIFASESKELKDIQFTFKSNGQDIGYNFSNIPLQRNYRTNIKGQLMSNDSEWTVTIDPIWTGDGTTDEDPYLVNYFEAGSIEAANQALANGETNIVIEEPADVATAHVVFPEVVVGKDVVFTLKGAAGKTIYFENAALTRADVNDGPATLTIVADKQNLDVTCLKTDVVLNLDAGETDFPVVKAKSLSISGVDGTVLKTGTSGKSLRCESSLKDVEIKTDSSNQSTDGALNVNKSSTFDNVKFTGAAKYVLVLSGQDTQMDVIGCDFANEGKGRGIMVWGGSPVINIEGSSFDNVYPFNVDGGTPVFTVTNSTLKGWTSYTGTATVSFEGCSFGKSTSGYAYCRPYSSTTFTECDFSSDFLIDFGASGITLTMNDCTIGGSAAVTKAILEPDLSVKDGILIINGSTAYPTYTVDVDGNYHIFNADGLSQFHDMYAEGGKVAHTAKVYIENDIDFTDKTWAACEWHADTNKKGFALFDGQNHTIKNFTVDGQGMFSRWAGGATPYFKDIVFDGAKNVTSTLNVSLFCGQVYQNAKIENVTIKNSQFEGTYKVAPFVGTVYDEKLGNTVTLTLKDCKVENTTVRGTSYDFDICGMVAFVYEENNDKIAFEGNNVVKDVTLYIPAVTYSMCAKIYHNGETAYDEAANVTVTNVNVVNGQ